MDSYSSQPPESLDPYDDGSWVEPVADVYLVEQPCKRCHATGDDPNYPGSDCMACEGMGSTMIRLSRP